LAITLSNLAMIKREQKQFPETERLLDRSLQILESEIRTGPSALGARTQQSRDCVWRYPSARSGHVDISEALTIAEKYLGTNHPTYAAVQLNYAEFLRANGRKAEAKTLEMQSKGVLLDSARRNGVG